MAFRIVGWIFVCVLASSGAGLAAGISKRDAQILDKQVFDLSGPIESGDLERLRALAPSDGQSIISFDSNGGDFQAGLALARYLHEKSIGTIVEDGRKCLSACAIAFLGGTALGLVTGYFRGIVDEADVEAGRVQIIAPQGFLAAAISENVIAGPIVDPGPG